MKNPATMDMHAHIASVSESSSSSAPADDDGSSSSSSSSSWPPPPPPPPQSSPWPKLVLDSGAYLHMVRDARLLSDLCDPPAGLTAVMAADGNTMPIAKVGNIRMPGFLTIPDVYLVPGLKTDDGVISVLQLARQSGIFTWFAGDYAMMYAGPKLVGVAVAPRENFSDAYVLQYLRAMPRNAAAGSSAGYSMDGDVRLMPVWFPSCKTTVAPHRLIWSQFSPIRVQRRKQLRLRLHMRQLSRIRALQARNDAPPRDAV